MLNTTHFFLLVIGITFAGLAKADNIHDSSTILPPSVTVPAPYQVLAQGTTNCIYAQGGYSSSQFSTTTERCSTPTAKPVLSVAYKSNCTAGGSGYKIFGYLLTACTIDSSSYEATCTDARLVNDNTQTGDGWVVLTWVVYCTP